MYTYFWYRITKRNSFCRYFACCSVERGKEFTYRIVPVTRPLKRTWRVVRGLPLFSFFSPLVVFNLNVREHDKILPWFCSHQKLKKLLFWEMRVMFRENIYENLSNLAYYVDLELSLYCPLGKYILPYCCTTIIINEHILKPPSTMATGVLKALHVLSFLYFKCRCSSKF